MKNLGCGKNTISICIQQQEVWILSSREPQHVLVTSRLIPSATEHPYVTCYVPVVS